MFGLTVIIAGMAAIMCGLVAAGTVRHIPVNAGLRTAGSIAATIGRCAKVIGGRLKSKDKRERGAGLALLSFVDREAGQDYKGLR